jgi:hypothetical protein
LYKNIINSFLLLTIVIFQFIVGINSYAASYFGSYLFCSTENGLRGDSYWSRKVDWNWSKGNRLNSYSQMNDKYKNFTYMNESGTWINGFGDISANTYQHFLLVRNTFENKTEAIQYCQTLEKKCVNEFGPSYKHVGVSSWSIPKTAWGTIAVRYKEDKVTKWTTCSNWKYSDYKELNYYPVWKVAGSATFAAAGLVIYPMTFIYAGPLIGAILGATPGALIGNLILTAKGLVVGAAIGVPVGTALGIYLGVDHAYQIYKNATEKMNQEETI